MEIHTNAKGIVGVINIKMLLIKKSIGWYSKEVNNILLPLTSFIPVFSSMFCFKEYYIFFLQPFLNKCCLISSFEFPHVYKVSVAVSHHWKSP